MKATKFISVTMRALLTAVVLFVIVVAALMVAEVSISMDRLRQPLIDAISESTGREVKVDGELRLTLSFFPALLVKGVHIYNGPGWQSEEIATLNEVQIEVALAALLDNEFVLQELSAKQAVVNLEQDAKGNSNWTPPIRPASPAPTGHSPDSTAQSTGDQPSDKRQLPGRFTFDRIRLNNVTLNYRDDATRLSIKDQVEKLHINMHDRSRLEAELSGVINDIPYTLSATSDLLRNIPGNKPWKLELEGEVAGKPLSLESDLQITDGILRGHLDMQTDGLDASWLFEQLGISEGLHFRAQQMHLIADVEGSSLQDLIDKSAFNVGFSEGVLKLKSHVDRRYQDISFEKTSLSVMPGQDMELEFTGTIGSNPVQFTLQTNPLSEFIAGLDEARLKLAAKLPRATVDLDGMVSLPVSSKTLTMNIAVSGERLDHWNSVLINDLPPIGPYKFDGLLTLSPGGYHVQNFRSKIANSEMSGSITIDMTRTRPVWKMDLVSNQLQLDDFDVEGYTLVPGKEITGEVSTPGNEIDTGTNQNADKTAKEKERELSSMVDQRLGETREIDHWDIDLTVESRNILSGKDRLGNGKIVISARVDSLDIDTHLNTLGGTIDSDVGLQLVEEGIRGHVNLDMDRFDYGIYLRRIDPDSAAGGLLSTRVNLNLAGKDFSRRFDHATGQIDFALWPQNINAGDIDIWAVNLFQAVSSSVTSTDSKLNCVVGIFNIENGQLNEEFLAVDTTKVWLYGSVDIHYPSESIELQLLPRTKKPKIAGIETPVYLKGKLTDKFDTSDLEIKKKDIAATITSIVFSPLHVPMRRIYGRKVPEDNSVMCGKLLDRTYLKSIKATMKENEISWDDVYSD